MGLRLFNAPALPKPPDGYEPGYFKQLTRILGLYFSQLDSLTPVQSEYFYGSGVFLTHPYAEAVSNTNQTAASTTLAYVVTFDTLPNSNDITLTSGTKLTIATAGIYLVTICLQMSNDTNGTETMDIWLRQNGTNIANSNNRYAVAARKGAGNPAIFASSTALTVTVAAGDYLEVVWHVSATTLSLLAIAAIAASGATPAIPATPSVVVSIHFISSS